MTPDKRATLLKAFCVVVFALLLVFKLITSPEWLAAVGIVFH